MSFQFPTKPKMALRARPSITSARRIDPHEAHRKVKPGDTGDAGALLYGNKNTNHTYQTVTCPDMSAHVCGPHVPFHPFQSASAPTHTYAYPSSLPKMTGILLTTPSPHSRPFHLFPPKRLRKPRTPQVFVFRGVFPGRAARPSAAHRAVEASHLSGASTPGAAARGTSPQRRVGAALAPRRGAFFGRCSEVVKQCIMQLGTRRRGVLVGRFGFFCVVEPLK